MLVTIPLRTRPFGSSYFVRGAGGGVGWRRSDEVEKGRGEQLQENEEEGVVRERVVVRSFLAKVADIVLVVMMVVVQGRGSSTRAV